MADNLEDLSTFVSEMTEATGVYIGELIRPKKAIAEDAGENDHIDEEAPEMIKYIHAPECMEGKTLSKEEGRTHEVFVEPEAEEEEEKPEEEMTPEELEAK